MNYKLITWLIGNVLRIEALLMIVPLIVSLIYQGGDHKAFLWSILILMVVGTLLSLVKPKERNFRTRDAFVVAGVAWFTLSIFGALPFYFSGYFVSFVDAVFESVSGFTTTGSTILQDVEIIPKGIMFWRNFVHWVGGMGVLMFVMAILPSLNATSVNLMRAESTGPSPDKVVPKIRETAKIMYLIYLGMTLVLIILLKLTGLPLYDSLINAFSVAGTGGFSNLNASVGGYNNLAAEIIMTVFMFLFGVNFSLYFLLFGRKVSRFFRDTELRVFFGFVVTSILIITFNIMHIYGGFFPALRHSSFQVSSIISTTGFATTNFDLWPVLSKGLIVVLMVIGSSAGSTAGGLKVIRLVILFKAARLEIGKIFHPGSIKGVSVNGKKVSDDILSRTIIFFFVYFVFFFVATLLVSIEGKDLVSNATAVISALSNVGPGLAIVGPSGNFSSYSAFSKIVMSFCMIAGRLEFFPVLVLFTPSVWKSAKVL